MRSPNSCRTQNAPTIDELREWCCNRDSCRTSAHHTSFPMKEKVQWQTLQVWQGVAKLELRDEGLCGSHRSAAFGRHVERLQVQGDECVTDGQGGLGRNLMRWHSRRRVECAGAQVSTGDRRRPQASCVNRVVCGSDSVPKDSGRILSRAPNTGHEVVVQVRAVQGASRKTPARWTMSTQLVWRSTVDHATTVSAGI